MRQQLVEMKPRPTCKAKEASARQTAAAAAKNSSCEDTLRLSCCWCACLAMAGCSISKPAHHTKLATGKPVWAKLTDHCFLRLQHVSHQRNVTEQLCGNLSTAAHTCQQFAHSWRPDTSLRVLATKTLLQSCTFFPIGKLRVLGLKQCWVPMQWKVNQVCTGKLACVYERFIITCKRPVAEADISQGCQLFKL